MTTFARPVRAPSPMPAADSMNTVFDDPEVAPPATAPTPSTMRAELQPREVAVLVGQARLLARPVIVPMASKKLVNTRVNTSMRAASAPIRPNEPNRST